MDYNCAPTPPVYSSDLVWVPQDQQAELFAESPIRTVHDKILIARLRPGQVRSVNSFFVSAFVD
jgi:hypothetical protein